MSGPMLKEMERLYALEAENERLRATIADLTAALDRIAVGDNAIEIARAAIDRAKGGKE